MKIEFKENKILEVPKWVLNESKFLEKNVSNLSNKIKIEDLTTNKNLHKIDIWRIFNNEEKYIDISLIYSKMSIFLDLWELLEFKNYLGFYIKPTKIIVKNTYPMFESLLFGLQKCFLTNKPFTKELLNETIRINDIKWLTFGNHILKNYDIDINLLWDETTVRIGYDNFSHHCNYFLFINDFDKYKRILGEELNIYLIEHIPKEKYPETLDEFLIYAYSDEYEEYVKEYEKNKELLDKNNGEEQALKKIKRKTKTSINEFLTSFNELNIK